MEELSWRAEQNLARVRNLVTLYTEKLGGSGSGRKPVNSTDLLRAATVLLHSALEDFLRSLIREQFPFENPEALNGVPLMGSSGRAEKFFLSNLAQFGNLKVEKLIRTSVSEYLDKTSFNNVPEVASWLNKIGVPNTDLDYYYEYIDELMSRRHHIVHQADRNDAQGQGNHTTKSISSLTVNNWIWAVEEFIAQVFKNIEEKNI